MAIKITILSTIFMIWYMISLGAYAHEIDPREVFVNEVGINIENFN